MTAGGSNKVTDMEHGHRCLGTGAQFTQSKPHAASRGSQESCGWLAIYCENERLSPCPVMLLGHGVALLKPIGPSRTRKGRHITHQMTLGGDRLDGARQSERKPLPPRAKVNGGSRDTTQVPEVRGEGWASLE